MREKCDSYGTQLVLEEDVLNLRCDFKCPEANFAGFSKNSFTNDINDLTRIIYIPDRPLRLKKLQCLQNRFKSQSLNSLNFKLNYRVRDCNDDIVEVQENGLLMRDSHNDSIHMHSVISIAQKPRHFSKKGSSGTQKKRSSTPVEGIVTNPKHYEENKRHFQDMMQLLSENEGSKPAFFAIGIDQLPIMNSAYGVEATDMLLDMYEKELQVVCSEDAVCLRIGGDKFGIFIYDGGQCHTLAKKILSSASQKPVFVQKQKIWMGVSIGLYRPCIDIKGDKDQTDPLFIEKAQTALRHAQKRGRGALVEFDPTLMNFHVEYSKTILDIGEMFLGALHANRLKMAYQPIMDVENKRVLFYESLLRLVDTQGNVIGADYMTPALQELGMMRIVDFYALQCAISELMSHPKLTLSVNVVQTSLTDPAWQDYLISKVKQSPTIGRRLIVEIIETGHEEPVEDLAKAIGELKKHGVRIAIDDFGAGHTSFSQLMHLDVDYIKIDKQFISHVDSEKSQHFIQALHQLAANMGITTIGEGVETPDHLKSFGQQGVQNVQGYLYGHPTLERSWDKSE